MKIVTEVPNTIGSQSGAIRNFSFATKGNIIASAFGFGNIGNPIAPKTLDLSTQPSNKKILAFINSVYQPGIADVSLPTILFKVGVNIVYEYAVLINFAAFPIIFEIENLNYTIETNMPGIIDGAVGYSITTYEGSIS